MPKRTLPLCAPALRAPLLALSLLAACSGGTEADKAPADPAAAKGDPLASLQIASAAAQVVDSIPLGTVPATVTLPPEARVAVTSQWPGAAVRVFVIEGQAVSRGQPLAVVRAAEPVQFGGELVRAQAEAGMAQARASRMAQLAREGIVAGARAEEAQAALRQAQAMVAENRRLMALSGASSDGMMTLRAPIGGRVSHVAVETGGPVDTMTAPFVIENPAAFQLDLQLPERLARSVRPGMAVEVQVMAPGGPIAVGGRILSVAPSIDPATRSLLAKASIGAAPGLVAGQNLSAVISGQGGVGGVAVPGSAVVLIEGESHVFVRSGTKWAKRKVTVVAEAGGRSVLADGLKAGEVVATSSVAELKAMNAE